MAIASLLTRLLPIALSVTVCCAAEVNSSVNAQPVDTKVTDAAAVGDPGVRLTRLLSGATVLGPRPNINRALRGNQLFFTSDSFLLKIGDVFVKDKTVGELSKLLSGPVSSKLQITLIEGDRPITKELTRYSSSELKEQVQEFGPLLNLSDLFGDRQGSMGNSASLGKTNWTIGNDFVAAPYFIDATERPVFEFSKLYDNPKLAMPDAICFFYKTGLFDRFDRSTKNALLTASQSSEATRADELEFLAKCASALADCHASKEARVIFDKLHNYLPHLDLLTRINVLKGRGSLLEATEPAAAVNEYKQLIVDCAQIPQDKRAENVDTLKRIVAYAVKSKNWNLAEAAQLRIIDWQRNPAGWIVFAKYQSLIEALSMMSDIYKLAGDDEKARTTLEEALSIYDKELNSDQRTLVERAFSLCPSAIEIKLASLYVTGGQIEKALIQVDAAADAVGNALGAQSAPSQAVQSVRKLLQTTSGDSKETTLEKASAQLFSLDQVGVHSYVTAITTAAASDDELSRQAFDLAKTEPSKSVAMLNQLLDTELSGKAYNADNIFRLITLSRRVYSAKTGTQIDELLKRIDDYLKDSPEATGTNRLYALTEIALHLDTGVKADATAADAWKKVETQLAAMRDSFLGGRGAAPSSADAMRDMLCVSYAYAFLNVPTDALKILKQAQMLSADELTRDVSPKLYEAVLYIMLGKMTDAQKDIDPLFEPPKGFRYDFSSALTALTAALHNTGHSDLALKLLEIDPNPAMKNSKRAALYRRAMIEYDLGKYREALNDLGEEENSALSGEQVSNYRHLRAELLAKTGEADKAITVMLKMGRRDMRPFDPLERSIALARTMKTVPPATIEMMVDAFQRTNGQIPSWDIEGVKWLCDKASQQHIAQGKLDDIDRRLAASAAAQGSSDRVATITISTTKKRAERMEAEHASGASYEFAELAREFMGQGKYNEGTAAMLHAIQMPSADGFNHGMYHPGNLRGDLGFTMLVNAKQYANAEKILKACIEMRKSSKYFSNAFIEKSFLAELFLEQNRFAEAMQSAKELLATMADQDGLCPPKGGPMKGFLMFSTIDGFTRAKRFADAQALLDDTTRMLLAEVGPRNALFIEDYQSQAKLLQAQNKLVDAEKFGRKALDQEKWVGGSSNAGRTSANLLASILRAEHKTAEADSVSITAEQGREKPQDFKKIYGVRNLFSHAALPDRYADTAEEPLKQAIDESISLHGEGSKQSQIAMDNLTKFYVQQNRYSEAEELQLRVLKNLDVQYGKCSVPKFGCYLYLAEIYLAEGKKDKALKFANQITEAPEDEHDFVRRRPTLRWAKVLISLGQSDKALEHLRQIEKPLLLQQRGFGQDHFEEDLRNCSQLMQQCGPAATNDVKALEAALSAVDERKKGLNRKTSTPAPPNQ